MRYTFLVLLILISLAATGCTNSSQVLLTQQIEELDTALNRGEISKSEYIKLKQTAQQSAAQQQATIRAGILASP
jgi:hypothetical protein